MIAEGWMNHKGGNFSADISDIEAHAHGTGKDVHCPGCKKKLHMDDFTPVKDDENETTHWRHACKECGAKLTVFNESRKPTFKQFLLREAKNSKNMFQFRIGNGDWEDRELHFDDLQDIMDRVNHPLHGSGKTDLSELTGIVEDWIGEGPDGPGTSWDEMDFSVQSMKFDVLKISYDFGGVNMRRKEGKYGTPVQKTGVITIMPGNMNEGRLAKNLSTNIEDGLQFAFDDVASEIIATVRKTKGDPAEAAAHAMLKKLPAKLAALLNSENKKDLAFDWLYQAFDRRM